MISQKIVCDSRGAGTKSTIWKTLCGTCCPAHKTVLQETFCCSRLAGPKTSLCLLRSHFVGHGARKMVSLEYFIVLKLCGTSKTFMGPGAHIVVSSKYLLWSIGRPIGCSHGKRFEGPDSPKIIQHDIFCGKPTESLRRN